MKKPFPFHPFLFGIFPVLSVYSSNLAFVPLPELWRPLGASFALSAVLFGLLVLIFRNAERAAVASSVLFLSAFCFQAFVGLLPVNTDEYGGVWMWGGLTLLITGLMTWKWKWTKLLNILSFFLVVIATGQIMFSLGQSVAVKVPIATAGEGRASATLATLPDIYYIVLDGYGRTDALQKTMNYSNQDFIDALRAKGFYIADQANSNYCQTELSIPSTLNYDFIQTLVPGVPLYSNDRRPLVTLIDSNAAAQYLHDRGYRTVSVTTGFPSMRFTKADLRMSSATGYSLLESALIQMTPIGVDPWTLTNMFKIRAERVQNALTNLGRLAGRTARPRFIQAHILAPHPPFVFGPDGQIMRRKGMFGYFDGSDYMDAIGTPETYRQGYVDQIQYINKRILEEVDRILAAPGPKPIIIIQGDHGSKMHLDQESLAKTDIQEAFPILSVYYVPDSVKANLYPSITPVNSFRVLFRSLFGDKMPLLPDQSWYSPSKEPYRFEEVTKQLATRP